MDDNNWVKLHRRLHGQFSRNKIKDYKLWSIYVNLLERANWQDSAALKEGELITTVAAIMADVPVVERQEVRGAFKKFKQDGLINYERVNGWNNQGYKISMLNYPKRDVCQNNKSIYNDQNQPTTNQQLTNNQPTYISDNIDENSLSVQQLTNNQPTTNQTIQKNKELRIKKENNNNIVANESNSRISDIANFWNVTCQNHQKVTLSLLLRNQAKLKSIDEYLKKNEFSNEDVFEAIRKIASDPFYNQPKEGKDQNGKPYWRPNFDYLFQYRCLNGSRDLKEPTLFRVLNNQSNCVFIKVRKQN